MTPPGHARRGRWLLAGGLAGLALSGPISRMRGAVRRRAARAAAAADPVSAFTRAPCYSRDRQPGAGTGDRTERVG